VGISSSHFSVRVSCSQLSVGISSSRL
jgi:hypothetical protein